MTDRLLIGAMSGTSCDGVDAALVGVAGVGLSMRATLLGEGAVAFDDALRRRILDVRAGGAASLRGMAEVTRDVTLAYADAVAAVMATTRTAAADILAVAAHGQTVFHDPPLTVQLFDPALLAYRCGIDVVSDFRRADCAAGGQGAPLVPWADVVLFGGRGGGRGEGASDGGGGRGAGDAAAAAGARVILNLGGIANVTVLPGGGDPETIAAGVTGFDVGPGNCLSDGLMRDAGGAGGVGGGEGVDVGGRRALRGRVDAAAVAAFLADGYICRPPPKSTDGPAMVAVFARATAGRALSLDDALATAAAVVAECVLRQTPGDAELVVAGGGVHNAAIMAGLRRDRRVTTTDALGVPAQAREAMAFALLGAATLDRVPANLPRVTGAARAVVLGAVTPKP